MDDLKPGCRRNSPKLDARRNLDNGAGRPHLTAHTFSPRTGGSGFYTIVGGFAPPAILGQIRHALSRPMGRHPGCFATERTGISSGERRTSSAAFSEMPRNRKGAGKPRGSPVRLCAPFSRVRESIGDDTTSSLDRKNGPMPGPSKVSAELSWPCQRLAPHTAMPPNWSPINSPCSQEVSKATVWSSSFASIEYISMWSRAGINSPGPLMSNVSPA